jgi:hypothetical protein
VPHRWLNFFFQHAIHNSPHGGDFGFSGLLVGASAMMRMIGSVLLERAWTRLLGQSIRIPSRVSTFNK